jgi:hypothetical protein
MKNIGFIIFTACTLFLSSCEKAFDSYNVADIPTDFTPLAKPAAGKGFQMHIEPFPVQANFERELWVRKSLGNTEEVYINSFEMKARPGTHHTIAYRFGLGDELPPENVIYDQNMPNNTIARRAFKTSGGQLFQSPAADYKFQMPKGYAIRMDPNTSFMMNMHYFNKTDKTRFGELYMNYYTVPKSEVEQELEVLYLEQAETIVLPPNKKTTLTTTFMVEEETVIPMLLSHYHKLGEKFEMRITGGPRNGELVYSSADYENPLLKTFATPLVLKVGEGLTSIVTYNNTTNRIIRYGVTSEDEMNIAIVFGYRP